MDLTKIPVLIAPATGRFKARNELHRFNHIVNSMNHVKCEDCQLVLTASKLCLLFHHRIFKYYDYLSDS